MAKIRLDKWIASTGIASRKEVKLYAKQGRISVNGTVVRSAEEKLDPETETVLLDGKTIVYQEFTYVMMHKPAGVLSATEDKREKTVLDLLPPELQKQELFPVGRLDKDTEGLLLLTNDGALAHELLSPRHHVDKVYLALTEGCVNQEDCAAFEAGMELGDGLKCMPAGLEILEAGEESRVLVTLREGKFHQVKRMLAACGKPVKYLKRLSMGSLLLDEKLDKGTWRFLESSELEELKAVLGDKENSKK